jgi:epoxyqueuosine reductase
MSSLSERIIARAQELGFVCAGIVPADPLPHGDAYRRWVGAGMHGELQYLQESAQIRDTPTALLPTARSIVAVAASYKTDAPRGRLGRIARYARGYDYHNIFEKRLALLAGYIQMELGAPVRSRASVDRLPLLERDVAYLAGLGWYGKNTILMNRKHGSYLLLGELLVDADLGAEPSPPMEEYCGSCTACMDACPTQAFVAPYVLDARRCISYLTIEIRGPIPREWRPAIGDHLFGCDICQEVCPWNRKAPPTTNFPFLGRPEIERLTAPELLQMDAQEFHARLHMSPLQRAHRPGLLRNAAVVLGNSGDRRWVTLLTHSLDADPEPLVRGHAAWALGRLGGDRAERALALAAEREADPYVQEEIAAARAEVEPA